MSANSCTERAFYPRFHFIDLRFDRQRKDIFDARIDLANPQPGVTCIVRLSGSEKYPFGPRRAVAVVVDTSPVDGVGAEVVAQVFKLL